MSERMDGYGYGSGDGDGYGYGYGSGYGYGDGDGDGHDFGCGDDFGYGHGHGYKIGTVGDHEIYLLRPWLYVAIGCECHSIDWWRDNWRSVSRKENVSVSDSQVEDILCKITSCAAE